MKILAAEDLKILNQHFNKEKYPVASLLSMVLPLRLAYS